MSIIKRSLLSVFRQKWKTLILFISIFVLSNTIAVAISIQQNSLLVENSIKKKLGGSATIEFNYTKHHDDETESDIPPLPISTIKSIGQLDSVKSYDYNRRDQYRPIKLKKTSPTNDYEQPLFPWILSVKGVNTPSLLDIEFGKIKIKKGRLFSEDEISKGLSTTLISKELAEKNNLVVGDTLLIDHNVYNQIKHPSPNLDSEQLLTEEEIFTNNISLEIIGLFEVVPNTVSGTKNNNKKVLENYRDETLISTIYLPNKTLTNIKRKNIIFSIDQVPEMYSNSINSKNSDASVEGLIEKNMKIFDNNYTPYYTLKNIDDSETFRSEATALLKNDYYKIIMSADKYETISTPVRNITALTNYFLRGVIIASITILILIIILFLYDRKLEFGIYLALGETKKNVILQISIEIILISVLSISLSMFTGDFLTKKISDELLVSEMDKVNTLGSNTWEDEVFVELNVNYLTEVDVANDYQIKMTVKYVVVFLVLSSLIIITSIALSLIFVLRLNPNKLLM